MIDWSRMFKYSAIALVVILFVVLGGWYIYLKNETTTIESADQGRGSGESGPPPSSTLGSMFGNIVSGFKKSDEAVRMDTSVPESTGGGLTSFVSRLFGRQGQTQEAGQGISSFSGSVKNAFSDLVSGIVSDKDAANEPPRPPRLWHAQQSPVAGFDFIGNASTTLRFMERSTGHLFDVNTETGTVRRISNTLIPKAYEATFAKDGSVIARVVDGGDTIVFSGVVGTSTAKGEPAALLLTELGDNIIEIVPSKDTRELVSLITDSSGFALVRSGWGGEKPRRLAGTTLRGWRLYSTRKNMIVSQDPASTVAGYAYEIETNGTFTPLVREIPGLTVLPHDSSDALLIGSEGGSVTLAVQTATSSIQLPIRTIADKCVWAPDNSRTAYCAVPENITSSHFIDEWYRGTYHTEDSWWKVDARAGTAELLLSPKSEMSISLDVSSPTIDDEGEYLAFMNTLDQSLWVLRISDQ